MRFFYFYFFSLSIHPPIITYYHNEPNLSIVLYFSFFLLILFIEVFCMGTSPGGYIIQMYRFALTPLCMADFFKGIDMMYRA